MAMTSNRFHAYNIPTELRGNVTYEYHEYIQLSRGISQGNVEAVKDFLNHRPDAVDAWINLYETPLLKACACGDSEIVKEILGRMTPEQMIPKKTDEESYHTPLTVVAESGNMEIAEALVTKNPNLIETPGRNGKIPVVVAVEKRQRKMARYLYVRTPVQVLLDQDGYHGTELFVNAIFYKMLEIALDLFGICKRLAFTENPQIKWIPIIVLASKPDLFPSGCQNLGPLKRLMYSCIQVRKLPILPDASRINEDHYTILGKLLKCLLKWTGIDEVYQLKVMHLQVKKLLLGISEETLAISLKEWSNSVVEALRSAVRSGNAEFLVEMVKNNSELLWLTEHSSSGNLFFLAIEYRQREVLNFLYGLKQRHLLPDRDSWFGTGMLHLASSLAPPDRLATLAGAPLQMQSELKWFMEIERIAPEIEKERREILKDNAMDSFARNHQKMRKEAQKSMKAMAGSCSLVATLIVTITFTAIITLPGEEASKKPDLISSTGSPRSLQDVLFKFFLISDMISCSTACTSVLIFLSIITSRYSFEDFLFSLPMKMIAGLSLMFISIAAMLLSFWLALSMTPNGVTLSFFVLVIICACFPALVFVHLQYPLLMEMIVSTYGRSILDRNIRPITNNFRSTCPRYFRKRNLDK